MSVGGQDEGGRALGLPREPQTDLPVAASSMGCLRAMLTFSCTDSTWVPLSWGRRGEGAEGGGGNITDKPKEDFHELPS